MTGSETAKWRPWEDAWRDALYGPAGFFVTGRRGARRDFSTSATRSPRLAEALATLLLHVLPQLGGARPQFDVVDLGAGDGRLLADLKAALPPSVAARGHFTAVELGPRPAGLDAEITWSTTQPATPDGLVIAHEWLDNVPCPVVAADDEGVIRIVEVDGLGRERVGRCVDADEAAWLARWWPLGPTGSPAGSRAGSPAGTRAEVGLIRDTAWLAATAALGTGVALAVDYFHLSGSRPAGGSLTGYRAGRQVPPVPDGLGDITAHVALDSCARPGDLLLTQRDALLQLGVSGTAMPGAGLADLRRTGEEGRLLDPRGAGGFGWLIHPAGQVDVGDLLR